MRAALGQVVIGDDGSVFSMKTECTAHILRWFSGSKSYSLEFFVHKFIFGGIFSSGVKIFFPSYT